jgi:hypothetical protein
MREEHLVFFNTLDLIYYYKVFRVLQISQDENLAKLHKGKNTHLEGERKEQQVVKKNVGLANLGIENKYKM